MQQQVAEQTVVVEPDLPAYSIANILKLRRKLETHADLLDYCGAELSGPLAARLHTRLRNILPDYVQPDALWGTLEPYVGRELTDVRWKRLLWRIAGNLTRLKQGRVLLPYRQQKVAEWVPMQVLAHKRVPARYGKPAAKFQFCCLAGTPAGVKLYQTWSFAFCRMLAQRLGFSKWADGKYPYRHYAELNTLRLYGLFTPDLCVKDPNFREIRVPAGLLSWNKKIIAMRARVDFACPEDFDHPCHSCHIGADKCPAATHPHTYQFKKCPSCSEPEAPFEVGPGRRVCVNCQTRRDMGIE